MTQRGYLFRPELWTLVERMLKGELSSIHPELSSNSFLGYRYPTVENIMGTTTKKAVDDLELLTRIGILQKEISIFTSSCTKCNSSLIRINQICPECQEQTVSFTPLIECLNCGYIHKTDKPPKICPSCKHAFKRKNEDYIQFESNYCLRCSKPTSEPSLQAQCINCGWTEDYTKLNQLPLYTYHFNVDEKTRLFRLLGSRPLLSKEISSREKKVFRNRVSQRILNMLQKNARRSYRDIGRRLGVSEATIRARVKKFRKEGIIRSFTALLDPKKVGIDQLGILKLKGSPEVLKNAKARLRTMHEIKIVYEINSSLELVAVGYFRGINHMTRVINNIGQINGLEILEVLSSTNTDKMDFNIDIEKYLANSD